jgi:hypothetical protein
LSPLCVPCEVHMLQHTHYRENNEHPDVTIQWH